MSTKDVDNPERNTFESTPHAEDNRAASIASAEAAEVSPRLASPPCYLAEFDDLDA